MEISVIIPTFNEELTITKTLDALSRLVNVSEVVVVDGGSTDETLSILDNYKGLKKLQIVKLGEANRGKQLHEGTKVASGDIFWFIHADTRPTQGSAKQIKGLMKYSEIVGGNFEIIFAGNSRSARFMTWLYPNLLSIGLCYGDSAFFVRKDIYEKIGGFKPIGAFEDLDLYHRLRKKGRFYHLSQTVTTSSRRFEGKNFVLTFAKWSIFQVLYWLKFPPEKLAKYYLPVR
jgi:rSAM/selenodomain-associated transferase 2